MTERLTRPTWSRTASVVLALAPERSVAVIVVVPGLTPVASPVASIVATALLLLVHVAPVPVIVTGVEELVVVPLPNCPKSFWPQHCAVPSLKSAQVWCHHPPVTATTPVMPTTRTGVDEPVLVPSPSCPSAFRPQHRTVPSPRSAQVCSYPPLTATALVVPPARAAVSRPPLVPSPSCPSAFRPQHRIVWSPRSAQACSYPPLTAMAPVIPITATGTVEILSKVPSPRCPELPSPQHLAVLSPRSTHANSSPAATWIAVVRPLTETRTEESSRVPSPSCPNWLCPTHCTVPSGRRTQVYSPPAEAAMGVLAPFAVNCCV